MRQQTLHNLILIAIVGIGLAGCHADVDLNQANIDSQLQAKLSLPLGQLNTSFANMMGVFGEDADIHINEDGLLEMTIDEHREREFHKIDLKNYIGEIHSPMYIADVNPALVGTGIPANTETDLSFKLDIEFKNGLNDNTSEERLDSLVIEKAEFRTTINCANLTIQDKDIQKVVMRLGNQFHSDKKEYELENRLGSQTITLENFTLVMMADTKKDPGSDNVLQKADITFIITLKTGETVAVTSTSGFSFDFEVEFMDYAALFGYFEPSEMTRDESSVEVPIKMSGGYPFVMPAKDPEITLAFTYRMSIPLQTYFYYIRAIHPDGYTPALWDGSESTTKTLNNIVPLDSPYDTSVKSTILLSKKETDGQIDRFFEKEVTDMAYKYELQIDNAKVKAKSFNQFRLTKNTQFELDFHFKMPFNFKKGLDATYADTVKDVSLEKASLKEIEKMTNGYIKDIGPADAALYMVFNNEIPVELLMDVEFLDENNQVLTLSKAPLKNIKVTSADMKSLTDITPVQSTAVVAVQAEDFETLSKTRAIRFLMHMGDKVKESAFPASKKLTIKIGVTADVQATLNIELGKLGNNQQQQQ
ncbi:MAG: hypothetical protein J6W89_00635 [Paludibacteraceae bacterium]|nr:hypothetical protein [Paludibacteraceae bacterium]